MFWLTSYPKILAQIAAPCVVFLIPISGLGCGSNLQPAVSKNKTTPTEVVSPNEERELPGDTGGDNLVLARSENSKAVVSNSISEAPPQVSPAEQNPEQVKKTVDTGEKYTAKQLNRNHTKIVLAYEPDARARYLINPFREQLTLEQKDQAIRLLLRYDYQYQRLIRKRQEVLNVAVDGDGETAAKLHQIKVATVDLSVRLRSLIRYQILTPEQQLQRHEQAQKAKRLAKEAAAEKGKLKR